MKINRKAHSPLHSPYIMHILPMPSLLYSALLYSTLFVSISIPAAAQPMRQQNISTRNGDTLTQSDLPYNPEINRRINERGWTLLHQAAYDENLEEVKRLRKEGALILYDYHGYTPQYARYVSPFLDQRTTADAIFLEIRQWLDVDSQIRRNRETFEMTRQSGHDILREPNIIMQYPNLRRTPLHQAVREADLGMAKALLACGARLIRDINGHWPHEIPDIQHARIIREKHPEVIQFVKQKGNNAAVRIQALFRGFLVRKLLERSQIIFPRFS